MLKPNKVVAKFHKIFYYKTRYIPVCPTAIYDKCLVYSRKVRFSYLHVTRCLIMRHVTCRDWKISEAVSITAGPNCRGGKTETAFV